MLTGFAVMIGVGLLGGSLIYGDTAKAAFFDDLARSALGVDIVARPVDPVGASDLTGRPALDAVASLPGVAHADGRVITELPLLNGANRVITNGGSVGFAISLPSWSGFSMFRTVEGRLPATGGEAALDRPTAAREHVVVGGAVTVLAAAGHPYQLRVVGIVDFGASARFSDRSVVALTDGDLQKLTGDDSYAEIVAAAEPGTDLNLLRQRLADTLGTGYRVGTGDEMRHELATESAKYVDGFLTTLLASALVAIVVSCLAVYNTFRILIAQRTRQLALLRCAGATRRQLAALVLGESLAVGLIASVGSTILSGVIGQALLVGRDLVGGGMPDHDLIISRSAIVIPLLTGTVVTVLGGLLPALSASRVSPLAALQASADASLSTNHRGRYRVLRTAGALLLAGAGLALVRSGRGRGFDGVTAMVGGAMTVFVAIVVVMPVVVASAAHLLGWLPGRLFGVPARLARGSARRNPIRFAATTTAMMIGVAPLALLAVVLATARVQADKELAENFPIDFVVQHADVGKGPRKLSSSLIERTRAAPEFGAVTLTRIAQGQVDGGGAKLAAVEPNALGTRVTPEVIEGTLDDFRPASVALRGAVASSYGLTVGDRIEVGAGDDTWHATVVAIFDDSPVWGDVLVDWSDFAAHLSGDDCLLIRRAERTDAADAAAALDAAVADDPLAVVSSVAQHRETLADSLNRRLVQFDVLLGLSLLIATFGIANTLWLSVLERTSESATLRALGLAARQLRVMLLIEALLMALIGALIGALFGIGFGWLAAQELITAYGHGAPEVPVQQIASYVGLAALAGALASVLPARRAVRASIIAAMADT